MFALVNLECFKHFFALTIADTAMQLTAFKRSFSNGERVKYMEEKASKKIAGLIRCLSKNFWNQCTEHTEITAQRVVMAELQKGGEGGLLPPLNCSVYVVFPFPE